jgi:hypothetical protein
LFKISVQIPEGALREVVRGDAGGYGNRQADDQEKQQKPGK